MNVILQLFQIIGVTFDHICDTKLLFDFIYRVIYFFENNNICLAFQNSLPLGGHRTRSTIRVIIIEMCVLAIIK